MRTARLTAGPYAAGSATFFAASQAPTSGTALTLVATAPVTPRRVLLTFGNDVTTSRTFTLKGTNVTGDSISEVITVPSGAGTAVSVLDYATLVSATPTGSGWSANVSLGTGTSGTNTPIGSSAWVRLDDYGFAPVNLGIDVTGTVNVTVESSDDDPNLAPPLTPVAPSAMTWVSHPNLQNYTVKANDYYPAAPRWVRLTFNSGTAATASATLIVTQQGGKGG